MQLEKGKISCPQLILLVTGYLMGSSLILTPGGSAENNAWLAVIVGFLEASVFAWTFISLMNRYPGKTLIEMNDRVLGPYLGKIVSLFYLWYFFHIGAMVLRNFGDFFSNNMPATPLLVFLSLTLLICAAAVRHGIEVISRSSCILMLLFAINFITITLLAGFRMDFSNFLPFMNLPIKDFLFASHSAASFPFGEVIAFTMIIPFINNTKNAGKSIAVGLGISFLFYFTSAVRSIAVLGDFRQYCVYPVYTISRLIDVGEIITRVEILIAINLLTMGYLYITVVYYGTVLGMAQLFNLRSYKPLILPIGILMLDLSILQFDSYIENIIFTENYYPYYSLPFEFLLPLITLAVAAIRKFPGRTDLEAAGAPTFEES